jgi:transposase-like protein
MKQTVIQYSEAFKRQVVEELEGGRYRSVLEAQKKYGIRGCSTVQRWMKQYGREHLLPKIVRVERMGERDRIKALEKRIQQLEKALADAKVDQVLSRAYLELACEEFGITDLEAFKKNADRRLFSGDMRSGTRRG